MDSSDGSLVQWPFAFGLSYTSFSCALANGFAPPAAVASDAIVSYPLNCTNTGSVAGDVVVFGVITQFNNQTTVAHPPRQSLFAFARIHSLAPGSWEVAMLPLTPASRTLYDTDGKPTQPQGMELQLRLFPAPAASTDQGAKTSVSVQG